MTIVGEMVFQDYLSRMERRGRTPKALRNYRRCYTVYQDWAEASGLDVQKATTDDLEDYFAHLGTIYAPNTLRSHLKALSAAYQYAQRRGVVPSDPTVEVELPSPEEHVPEIIPTPALREIRDECKSVRDLALWGLLAWTGMRRIEVCRLAWTDVNFKTASLTVRGKRVKGETRLRYVPLHPELALILRELPYRLDQHVLPNRYGGEMGESTFDYRLGKLTEHSAHSFRRTVASNLYRNGVQEATINRILGWGARTMFQRFYLNLPEDDAHRAILRLYVDDPL